jgi:hypothetical protein
VARAEIIRKALFPARACSRGARPRSSAFVQAPDRDAPEAAAVVQVQVCLKNSAGGSWCRSRFNVGR